MRIRAVYENNVFTRFKGLRAVTSIILMHITYLIRKLRIIVFIVIHTTHQRNLFRK